MIPRDDVLRMAREGAIAAGGDPAICTIEALSDTEADALVRFAALVAASEREEIIRVLEIQLPFREDVMRCAAAIRARGEK